MKVSRRSISHVLVAAMLLILNSSSIGVWGQKVRGQKTVNDEDLEATRLLQQTDPSKSKRYWTDNDMAPVVPQATPLPQAMAMVNRRPTLAPVFTRYLGETDPSKDAEDSGTGDDSTRRLQRTDPSKLSRSWTGNDLAPTVPTTPANRRPAKAPTTRRLQFGKGRSSDDYARPVPVPVPPPRQPPAPISHDIMETLIRRGGYETLIKLLFTSGLAQTLKTPGPFTVFAPINSALPSGDAMADFVASETLVDLNNVLKYHVVAGKLLSTDLVDGARLRTLAGNEIVISLTGGAKVNNANIIMAQANVGADNGVIHGIDALLMNF